MKRTFLRQVLTVLGTCALYLPIALTQSIPVQAATFTFTDSNCSSFNFDSASGTLTCVTGGGNNPPTCTITGAHAAQLSTTNTLTASCNPSATSWVWTQDQGGTQCSSSPNSTCNDNQANPITINYTVTGTNANGAGPTSAQFQVIWSASVAPSGCTVSYSPSSTVSAGTPVTLTVNCTQGTGPFTYAWTGSPFNGQSTNPTTAQAVNAAKSGTVTVTNATGNSGPVNWSVAISGGGGGGGGSADCTPQGYPSTKNVTIAWPTDGSVHQVFPADYGGMGPNDALVIKFTTSSVQTASTAAGYINAVEYGSPTSARNGSLSLTPCDFSAGLPEYKCSGATSAFAATVGPNVGVTMNASKTCKVNLQPSTTYYFNIINTPGSISCASTGVCDMLIQFVKPGGT